MLGRIHLEAMPPPALDEALLEVFRATMRFYVTHRDVAMPRIITLTLISMRQAADDPLAAHRAILMVGCAVLQKYNNASFDQAVIDALSLAHNSLKAYQA